MKTQRECFSCGRVVEGTPGEAPCHAFKGWLTVSRCKGVGSVEHHHFCSFKCLKDWVDTQMPNVPDIFLKYFNEGKR